MDAQQYVLFGYGPSEFGIAIDKVHEIVGVPQINRLPQASSLLDGVVTLRDEIVPVIALGQRLGWEQAAGSDAQLVIIAVHGRKYGVVVDQVTEVRMIEGAAIDTDIAKFGSTNGVLTGIARLDQRLVLLLDPNLLLNDDEAGRLDEEVRASELPA
jgi:purine-binding chemotaxis protein CheW